MLPSHLVCLLDGIWRSTITIKIVDSLSRRGLHTAAANASSVLFYSTFARLLTRTNSGPSFSEMPTLIGVTFCPGSTISRLYSFSTVAVTLRILVMAMLRPMHMRWPTLKGNKFRL